MMKRWLSCLTAAVLLFCTLTACGEKTEIPGLTDAEAEAILTELLPKSNALMPVFFGEGLAYEEPESILEYDGVQYEPVKTGQAFSSVAEMKAAMEGVFTDDYKADLYVLMFDGYETPKETSKEGEEPLDETIMPRYRENEGVLEVDIKYESFDTSSVPEAKGAKVLRGNATRVVVEVSYTTASGERGTTKVNLALDGGVWLLDGPTY